jgi:hypothetical protein
MRLFDQGTCLDLYVNDLDIYNEMFEKKNKSNGQLSNWVTLLKEEFKSNHLSEIWEKSTIFSEDKLYALSKVFGWRTLDIGTGFRYKQKFDREASDKIIYFREKKQWVKDGELRGIEKGMEKGKLVEAHTFIGKYIKAQFGEDCRDLLAIVNKVIDIDLLEKLADVLFRTSRLEEAQKLVYEAYQEQRALD